MAAASGATSFILVIRALGRGAWLSGPVPRTLSAWFLLWLPGLLRCFILSRKQALEARTAPLILGLQNNAPTCFISLS